MNVSAIQYANEGVNTEFVRRWKGGKKKRERRKEHVDIVLPIFLGGGIQEKKNKDVTTMQRLRKQGTSFVLACVFPADFYALPLACSSVQAQLRCS